MYFADEKRYDKLAVRRAGNTGLQLPLISLGFWRNFNSTSPVYDRKQVMLKAFDEGIFSFDCADHYGAPEIGSSEKLLGEVLRHELKPYRDELVVTTKVGYRTVPGPYGEFLSRKTIIQSLDRSLERLETDYVDLYYAHRFDPTTDLYETARAFDQVVRDGKAMYIGISNFDTQQNRDIAKIFDELGTPYTVNQVSYNMLNQDAKTTGLIDELKAENKGLVAYGPLAQGLLTERYLNGIPENFPIHPTSAYIFKDGKEALVQKLNSLNKIAKDRGQTLSEMALSWLLQDEVVTSVIIGTSSVEHLEDNLKAAKMIEFAPEELQAINDILK